MKGKDAPSNFRPSNRIVPWPDPVLFSTIPDMGNFSPPT